MEVTTDEKKDRLHGNQNPYLVQFSSTLRCTSSGNWPLNEHSFQRSFSSVNSCGKRQHLTTLPGRDLSALSRRETYGMTLMLGYCPGNSYSFLPGSQRLTSAQVTSLKLVMSISSPTMSALQAKIPGLAPNTSFPSSVDNSFALVR